MLHLNVQEREQTSIQRISVSFRFETKRNSFTKKDVLKSFWVYVRTVQKISRRGGRRINALDFGTLCICPTSDERRVDFYMKKLLPKMPPNNCKHCFCHLCEGRHGVYYGVFRTLFLAMFLTANKIYCWNYVDINCCSFKLCSSSTSGFATDCCKICVSWCVYFFQTSSKSCIQ